MLYEVITLLRTLSPALTSVEGGMRYKIVNEVWTELGTSMPEIQIIERFGCSVGVPSSYDKPSKAMLNSISYAHFHWAEGLI